LARPVHLCVCCLVFVGILYYSNLVDCGLVSSKWLVISEMTCNVSVGYGNAIAERVTKLTVKESVVCWCVQCELLELMLLYYRCTGVKLDDLLTVLTHFRVRLYRMSL